MRSRNARATAIPACARKWMSRARDNLAETLALFFETAGTEEIDRRLSGEIYVTQVEVAVGVEIASPTTDDDRPPPVRRQSRHRTDSRARIAAQCVKRPIP